MPQLRIAFRMPCQLGQQFGSSSTRGPCTVCLLVYLTLIANAHRDLANDELDWGKITRCFPRHRYSSTQQQYMCSPRYRYSKLSFVCQPGVAESTLNSLESQAL